MAFTEVEVEVVVEGVEEEGVEEEGAVEVVVEEEGVAEEVEVEVVEAAAVVDEVTGNSRMRNILSTIAAPTAPLMMGTEHIDGHWLQ